MNPLQRPTQRLSAIQRNMFLGFAYDLVEGDTRVGEILWPTVAQAKNARLRLLKDYREGSIRVNLNGASYLIVFEHIRRGLTNDILFEMVSGNALNGAPVSSGTPFAGGCAPTDPVMRLQVEDGDVPSDTPLVQPSGKNHNGIFASARVLVPSGWTQGVHIKVDYPYMVNFRIKPVSLALSCHVQSEYHPIANIFRPRGLKLRRILHIDSVQQMPVEIRAFLLFLTLNSIAR